MEQYITYALQVIICSGLFYAFYKLWLEGRTDYGFCRFYLIGSALLSAAIPLLRIPAFAGEVIEVPVVPLNYYASYDISTVTGPATEPTESWPGVLLFGYMAILLFMLTGIASQLLAVGRYTKNARKTVTDGISIYESDKIKTPFSFFRKVFLPAGLPADERGQILTHERSHALHNHGLEILIMELLKALLWFNPFIWMSRMALEQVHEYQADSDVIETGCDIHNYKSLLFRQLVGYSPDISSGMACSKTKKRLIMMERTKPGRRSILRASAALPLVCGMLLLFSFTSKEPVYVYTGINGETAEFNLDEIATLSADRPQMYYFIDGQEVNKEAIEKLNPDDIESMNMVADEESFEKYNKPANSLGLTMVETKSGILNADKLTARVSGLDNPLIILDGVEISLGELKNDVDPDMVESITVLKDASATTVYGEKGKNGVIVITTKKEDAPKQTILVMSDKTTGENSQDDEPFLKVEESPTFQGGDMMTFRRWVDSQLSYPAEAAEAKIEGKVVVSFIIEKDGTLSSVQILSSPSKLLSNEVERVLYLSPKWEPGKQGGKVVRVRFNLPVDFQLNNGDDE